MALSHELADRCPECFVSLIGPPIPEADRHLYGASNFRREIGHEVSGVYDGVLFWTCPDCLFAWPAMFSDEVTMGYVNAHNQSRKLRSV